ncbi:MAG: DUF3365 domain-containing protein [Deltaproteobacteria bacterium]|nr:DUF3365 domain-containing protein [Deltaproteobacteria bacterium]
MSEIHPPAADPKRTPKSSSLQKKFLLGVGVIFLGFCLISAWLIYYHEKNLLEEAAYEKAEMVLAAAEASRHYIQDVLRPKMYEVVGKEGFVLEAMSTSFVSRAVMDRFRHTLPAYQYRRVALNARNPEYAPRPVEQRLIEFFSAQPTEKSWQGLVNLQGQAHFIHARPVYFEQSCLHCHGDPEDAPPALVERYGRERGFGHHVGEIAGISSVTIPVDVALAAIQGRAFSVFGISLFALSALFVGINFFFNRVVVHNLRDLLNVFRGGLRDEKELQLLSEAQAKDEIGELTAAAWVLVGHLGSTRKQLEEYAENLEGMVASRTEALENSRQALQDQVAERNRELKTLTTIAELITQTGSLREIFPRVLVHTLGLIPARGAALYLLQDNPPRLELQCQENAAGLIPSLPLAADPCRSSAREGALDLTSSLHEAVCGRMSFFSCLEKGESCLNTPLLCRGRVLGVMTFVEVIFTELTPERRELLQAIGHQIGVTIESLQSLTKLAESKELLQTVFDGITDMLVLLDRNLCIKMVNRAYLDYFGLRLDEVLERPCRLTRPDIPTPLIPGIAADFIATRKPLTEELNGADGRRLLVHNYPLFDDRGEVTGLVRYAKDITAEKQVEERIQQTEKLAALGQLAAGVAHELNNPLGVILCYVDLLKRELSRAKEASDGLKDLATIEKHAHNCQRIVADLLNFARSQETTRQLTALNPTITEVVQMVGHQFRQHCTIELDLDPTIPDLELDVAKMRQVYLNLLMNARQALKDSGVIRISTRYLQEAGQVQITFWDNGRGIASEIRGKIFDPFFSTKKTGEGTGLGLSVSYGIIQEHGGDIQVDSEPGQWTRFTITLPLGV